MNLWLALAKKAQLRYLRQYEYVTIKKSTEKSRDIGIVPYQKPIADPITIDDNDAHKIITYLKHADWQATNRRELIEGCVPLKINIERKTDDMTP